VTMGTRLGYLMRTAPWALLLICPLFAANAQEGGAEGETREFGGITFVWCPPGTAMMGSDLTPEEIAEYAGGRPEWYGDEGPLRQVEFERGFWISQNPVTVADWVRIGRAADLGTPSAAAGSDRPVTGVRLEEIRAFIDALSGAARGVYRLPTEDEWEYACRAGSESLYPFGDDPEELDAHAWHRGNTADRVVQPVGQKTPNAWGLHDMLGNAWEICGTPYGIKGTHGETPSAQSLVIRGGSVTSPAGFTRCAFRAGHNPETGHPLVSFRIVREVER